MSGRPKFSKEFGRSNYNAMDQVLTEAQLPAFKANIEAVKTDDERRDADAHARMPSGGRP
jgi:hypothetical protein